MRAFRLLTLFSLLSIPALAQASGDSRVCERTKTFQPTKNSTAEKLGWIRAKNPCGGYYKNLPLPGEDKPLMALEQNPIDLSFAEATIQDEGRSTFSDVTVSQPQRLLTGDIAYLNRNKALNRFETIDLYGNVVLREPGKLITGDTAKITLQNRTGYFVNVLYRLSLNPELSARPALLDIPGDPQKALTAHGRAAHAEQKAPGLIELDKATYSTCSPEDVVWQLRSSHVLLNRDTGRGVARHARLYVKNVPIFYTPYFSFPIDKRRKSGFLFPTYGNSKLGGFMLQVPYYWNIAPNYDATITPGWYSKRGIQLGTEFRYLTPNKHGDIALIVMPNDAAFASFRNTASQYTTRPFEAAALANAHTYRAYFAWRNMMYFSPRWSSAIDYMRVSDDYYFRDFSGQRVPATANQLLQQIDLKYTGKHWQFRGLLQNYQTLHPVTLAPVGNPYAKLPQLSLSASYPGERFGLVYQLQNEYTYFTRKLNPGEIVEPVVGNRLHIQPGVSLPINGISGYITPNLQMFMTGYQLHNQPNGFSNQQKRALPVFSLDSGLYFDKETTLGKNTYQQTLEPRIFYLYVPYADQSQLPLFDSAQPGFNYDQLFRTNRFNGFDRVGDANQVTLALTTRFIDQETGLEKFRASIGQIYYFQDRRVFSCIATTPLATCNPNLLNPQFPAGGTVSPTAKSSPLAGQVNYKFNPQWDTTANLTWDPQTRRTQNGNITLQYRPDKHRLLNLGYNFLQYGDRFSSNPEDRTNLSQTIISGAWPIKDRWQAVGSWNYNLSHDRSQTYFYGLEYNTCCWAARVVVGRTFTGLSPSQQQPLYNTTVYFQIQLKGFGNFGATNPVNALNTIPGYRDQFGQI